MPRGDRTGPDGQGARTGRGLGYCSGNDSPGFTRGTPRGGSGFRRRGSWFGGFRNAIGFRNGRGFRWNNQEANYPNRIVPREEKEMLNEEVKILEQEKQAIEQDLKDIEKRLKELK